MACEGCRRVVRALLWAGCAGGVLFSTCNASVNVPRGRLDVDHDEVFVNLPGLFVDVSDGHVQVDVPGVEIDIDGHHHRH